MPRRPRLLITKSVLLGLAALGLVGCQSPGSSRIVGPDGSAMAHVHCGSDQGTCFRIAGELCPTGYEMKPVLSGNDGNFLVRCRAGGAVAAAAPACPPPTLALPTPATTNQGALTSTRGSQTENWPPSTEPWPAAYPWPPPETSSGVRAVPSGPPSQEVDLGY